MKVYSVKKVSGVVLGILFATVSAAQAAGGPHKIHPNLPLIEKNNYTGYTTVDGSRSETCKVYQDRVVITRRFGADQGRSFSTKSVVKSWASTGIYNVIEAAALEELSSDVNYLCDAPSTAISFYQEGQQFNLFNSGGCGGSREQRDGPMSRMLVELVDKYCPTTYDFQPVPFTWPEPVLEPGLNP